MGEVCIKKTPVIKDWLITGV
jgi:hypothetical protein